VDVEDAEGTAGLLDFGRRVGTLRRDSVEGHQDAMRGCDLAGQLVVEDDGGVLVAAGVLFVYAGFGPDTAQTNCFLEPGRDDALELLVGAFDERAREWGVTSLLAHVSDPSDDMLGSMERAGFGRVGTRSSLMREISPEDAELELPSVEGVRVVGLAEHPELEPEVTALWCTAHAPVHGRRARAPRSWDRTAAQGGADQVGGTGRPHSSPREQRLGQCTDARGQRLARLRGAVPDRADAPRGGLIHACFLREQGTISR
jgi:hypothetical protein